MADSRPRGFFRARADRYHQCDSEAHDSGTRRLRACQLETMDNGYYHQHGLGESTALTGMERAGELSGVRFMLAGVKKP